MFLLFLTLFFQISSHFDCRHGFTEYQGHVWLEIPRNFPLNFGILVDPGGGERTVLPPPVYTTVNSCQNNDQINIKLYDKWSSEFKY